MSMLKTVFTKVYAHIPHIHLYNTRIFSKVYQTVLHNFFEHKKSRPHRPQGYECNQVTQIVNREICNLVLKFHNPMKICGTR